MCVAENEALPEPAFARARGTIILVAQRPEPIVQLPGTQSRFPVSEAPVLVGCLEVLHLRGLVGSGLNLIAQEFREAILFFTVCLGGLGDDLGGLQAPLSPRDSATNHPR